MVLLLSIFGVSFQPKSHYDLRQSLDNPAAPEQVLMIDFQSNQNFGNYNRSQDIFAIKQNYYSSLQEGYLVHHLQLPFISQPLPNENSSLFGFGDFDYRGYFTLQKSELHSNLPNQNHWRWGVGPAFEIPTGSDPQLSTKKWSAGLAVSLIYQPPGMSLGGDISQKWSFAGQSDRADVNLTEVDPIVKIYIGEKTTIGLLDTIKVDWTQEAKNRWTLPMGIEFGQLIQRNHERSPTNLRFGLFSNVVRPDKSSDWYWRFSIQFAQ
ncbi:MAG TPA: hypothetical protein VN132_09400 [Bdellovibrio sp.]|nr:hypothetical protein [Bdellovibrio sp.]